MSFHAEESLAEPTVAEVSIIENTNSSARTPSLSSENGEASTPTDECSSHFSNDTTNNRVLRSRWKRKMLGQDHDYAKVVTVSDNEAESDEDYKVDKEDEESDDFDDEDYKAPCLAKKARKTNSKTVKDAKYWERRGRNNLAAKRSREAKRAREIQIAEKTAALEKENINLKKQVRKLKAEIKKAEKMILKMV